MKKKLLRIAYIAFFFAFSITLFPLESEKEIIETEAKDAKNEASNEAAQKDGSASSDKMPSKKKKKKKTKSKKKNKKDEATHSSQPPANTESTKDEKKEQSDKEAISPSASQETKSEETNPEETKPEETKPKEQKPESIIPQNADFSSIQVTGLTIASGGKWYFEEYDEVGNVISKVSYDRNKMISTSTIQYSNGKRSSERITEGKTIINVRYNSKGEEIGREELKSKKNGETVPIASTANTYADDGKIKEESKTENGITTRRVYTYDKDKKTSETVYENDVQTLFIEYKENKKVVHVFDEGKEVSVFTEDIEGGN